MGDDGGGDNSDNGDTDDYDDDYGEMISILLMAVMLY